MSAEVAGQATVCEPLDTDTVSNLDVLVGSLAQGDDATSALVSSTKGEVGVCGPVSDLRADRRMSGAREGEKEPSKPYDRQQQRKLTWA